MTMTTDRGENRLSDTAGRGGALRRPVLTAVLAGIDALCLGAAWIAAGCTGLLALMMIVEIFATNLFNWSQPWIVEYGSYFLAAILFAGSGWTLKDGGHIRVGLVTAALGPRGERRLDLVATIWGLIFVGYATWALALYAARSAEVGSVSTYLSQTPLAYPQAVLAASVGLLWLALLARLLRLIFGLDPERPASDGELRE